MLADWQARLISERDHIVDLRMGQISNDGFSLPFPCQASGRERFSLPGGLGEIGNLLIHNDVLAKMATGCDFFSLLFPYSREDSGQFGSQRTGVERRADFGVVVEIHKDIAGAAPRRRQIGCGEARITGLQPLGP